MTPIDDALRQAIREEIEAARPRYDHHYTQVHDAVRILGMAPVINAMDQLLYELNRMTERNAVLKASMRHPDLKEWSTTFRKGATVWSRRQRSSDGGTHWVEGVVTQDAEIYSDVGWTGPFAPRHTSFWGVRVFYKTGTGYDDSEFVALGFVPEDEHARRAWISPDHKAAIIAAEEREMMMVAEITQDDPPLLAADED